MNLFDLNKKISHLVKIHGGMTDVKTMDGKDIGMIPKYSEEEKYITLNFHYKDKNEDKIVA